MHTSKAKCYAEGGLVGQLRSTANRLVGNNPRASQQRGRDPDVIGTDKPMPAATSAPAPMATNPGYKSGIPTPDNPAGIRFAGGGKVPGPKAETEDTVPAMLVPGEYVLKKNAVEKIGVDALDALNAVGGAPKAKARKKLRHRVARRKMQAGGLAEEIGRGVAPYVNHRPPNGPPAMPPPLALPNNVPPPGTAVATAPQPPNFTMPPGNQPPPAQPAFTDVRPKWNPANASSEAKAWLDSRTPSTAAAQPAPAPAATPAATPAAPSMVQQARSTLASGARRVGGAVAGFQRAAAPVQLATGIVNSLDTPTEDYRTRFAMGPNEGSNPYSAAVRDMGVRSLGLASDIGNAVGFGIPGLFYRDKQNPSGAPSPIDQLATPAAAPTGAPPAAVGAAPAQQQPAMAAPSNVLRVGNSYSGAPGISGDITINGAAPRGGFVSGTGDGSFRYGGGNSGVNAQNLGGNDQALFEARKAAIARGDTGAVEASYASQGQSFGPKVDPVAALMNNGKPMTVKKAAAIAALQRSAVENAGAQVETEGKGLANTAARELLKAQLAVNNAKDATSEAKAIDKLRALQGKYEKELPNRFTVVPGGEEIAPDGITRIKRPDRVINNQTGQWLDQPAAKTGPTPRAQYDQMKKGDRYIGTDGKEYIKG